MRIPTITQFSTQIETISQQNLSMSQIQQQISSQKKIQNSSDNPVLAYQIKSVSDYIVSLQSYDSNGTLAQNHASLFTSTVQNTVTAMNKISELTQAAKNDTLSNSDRINIANELSGYLTRIVNLANTQDGNGKFIYSGLNAGSPAFVQEGNNYQYAGSMDQVTLNIGPDAATVYNDSGFEVFGNIPTGNGTFTVQGAPSNTGTASTSPGSIVSTSSYVADTYTLSFVTNSEGELAYQVTGAASGQVIPTPPAVSPDNAPAYTPNTTLTFNGINIMVNGQPNVGDSFTIAPSTKQNIFNSLQNLITTLKMPVNDAVDKANFTQAVTQASSTLQQGSAYMLNQLATMGTRAAQIDLQVSNNSQTITQQEVILGSLSDVDPYKVISEFSQQTQALQLTQQVYLKIQQTLNEFLRM